MDYFSGGAMVMDADAFPLAFRSGGCFLDVDTPTKANVPGNTADEVPFSGVPTTLCSKQSVGASPLTYFSPSKSYSDAISATVVFPFSLRNYFALEKAQPPQQTMEPESTAAASLLPTPRHLQLLTKTKTSSTPTKNVHSNSLSALSGMDRPLQLDNLPTIRTSSSTLNQLESKESSLPFSCLVSAQDADLQLSLDTGLEASADHLNADALDIPCPASGWDVALGLTNQWEDVLDEASDTSRMAVSFMDAQVPEGECGSGSAELTPDLVTEAVSGESESMAHARVKRRAGAWGQRVVRMVQAFEEEEEEEQEEQVVGKGYALVEEEEEETDEEEAMDDEDEEEGDDFVEKDLECAPSKKQRKIFGGGVKKGGAATSRSLRMMCRNCSATQTPQWREGPEGARTLCNACGLRWRKGLPLPCYKK